LKCVKISFLLAGTLFTEDSDINY